jgi:hypothetical protein
MNYLAAFQDFFKSPKWTMNLLLGAICSIIPIVGMMVVLGWLLGGFWGRSDERAETFPDFNFDKFGKYLERGLWPGLLLLVASMVIVPVFLVVAVMAAMILGTSGSSFIAGLFIKVIVLAVFAALSFFLVPMILRAGLMQDFGAGFNVPFIKRFVNLTKSELGVTVLCLAGAGFVLMIVGKVMCIGTLLILAAVPVINFAWAHLSKQLYALYLTRGGEPLLISPKLVDAPMDPPPAPPAPMA